MFYIRKVSAIIVHMFSETATGNMPSMGIFLAYGLLILLYLFILRLLLNLIQRMGDKGAIGKSIIDRDIHQTMTNEVETSMHAFNAYNIAIIIVKFAVAAIAMGAIEVIMVMKFGVLAAALLTVLVVLIAWAFNHWLKSKEEAHNIIGETRKFIANAGSAGTVVLLTIALVVVIFVMIFIQ